MAICRNRFKGSANYIVKNDSGQLYIAEVKSWSTDAETEANAKLIAMAPELLACCKELIEEMTTDDPKLSNYKKNIIAFARAVIKQATQ